MMPDTLRLRLAWQQHFLDDDWVLESYSTEDSMPKACKQGAGPSARLYSADRHAIPYRLMTSLVSTAQLGNVRRLCCRQSDTSVFTFLGVVNNVSPPGQVLKLSAGAVKATPCTLGLFQILRSQSSTLSTRKCRCCWHFELPINALSLARQPVACDLLACLDAAAMRQPKQPASGNTAAPRVKWSRAAQQADPCTTPSSRQRAQFQAMHDKGATQGRSGLTVRLPSAEAPSSAGHISPASPVLARVRHHATVCQAAISAVQNSAYTSHISVQMMSTQ